jgi:hypothetical protein
MTSLDICAPPAAVEAIVLFGSCARGDADAGSDTDVAVFAMAESPNDLVETKQSLSKVTGNANLSVYSTRTTERMAEDGSLFLWHVRLEGQTLYTRSAWFQHTLTKLQAYRAEKAARDIASFEIVIDDIVRSLSSGSRTLLFEAATLFAVVRSLGMIVEMRAGVPSFSRSGPVQRLQHRMGSAFPLSDTDVSTLLAAKLLYSQKANETVELRHDSCTRMAHGIREIVAFAKRASYEEAY